MRKTDVAMRRKPRKRPRNRRNIRRETRVRPFLGYGSVPKPGKLDARNVLLQSQMEDRAFDRMFAAAFRMRPVYQIHDELTIEAEVPDQPVLIDVLHAMDVDAIARFTDEELQDLRDWFASEERIRGPNFEDVEAQIAERLGESFAEEMDEMIVNGYVANEETMDMLRDAAFNGRVRSQRPNMQELPSDRVEVRGKHFEEVPVLVTCQICGDMFRMDAKLATLYANHTTPLGTARVAVDELYDCRDATCKECKRLQKKSVQHIGRPKRRVLKL